MKSYFGSLRMTFAFAACVSMSLFVDTLALQANDSVTMDLSYRRSVGEVSEFDRSKYIVLHSSLMEPDWNGEEDKIEYVLNGLDVYLGRDNGGIGWHYNQVAEDPLRPAFADPADMATRGAEARLQGYGIDKAHLHKYEDRVDGIIGAQYYPFWPGSMTDPCCGGSPWGPTTAEGSGNYMGQYLQEFYRDADEDPTQGQKRPRFIEVMNEPLYEFVTTGDETPLAVFEYHNTVAAEIRKVDPDVLIGGYTTAFPYFDERGFDRWHERYKLFMDTAAENMDFLSLHFYDFDEHGVSGGGTTGPWNFKGGRIEATFDMIEQYSDMKFGFVKPMLISEYGGRNHRLEQQEWTPQRDWVVLKSFSPLMLSFMDRPNQILKAIPFMLVKAEWAETTYVWRLLRQKKEAEGETGDEWVYTELIKFYQLWSDVKGTRVRTKASDRDLLVDAYLDGEKAYLILSNLETVAKDIDLNLLGGEAANLIGLRAKQLYADAGLPRLSDVSLDLSTRAYRVESEATAILEFEYDNALSASESMTERKYYADTYLQEIKAGKPIEFAIDGVELGAFADATLRIGIGRDHGLDLMPLVRINGVDVETPADWQGDDQSRRNNFYGLIEVPIPAHLLGEGNRVELTFADTGGHVSSLTLRTADYSAPFVGEGRSVELEATGTESGDLAVDIRSGRPRGIVTILSETDLSKPVSRWSVSKSGIELDESGRLQTRLPVNGDRRFFAVVDCPECLPAAGAPQVLELVPESIQMTVGGTRQLAAIVGPVNAIDRRVVWDSADASVASVSVGGLVSARSPGDTVITVRTVVGDLEDQLSLHVIAGLSQPGVAYHPSDSAYLNTQYEVGSSMEVSCLYDAGAGRTVGAGLDGVTFMLRRLRSDWSVVSDLSATDTTAIGMQSGIATASIDLSGLTPSADLPAGQFYFLFTRFQDDNGKDYNKGLNPIKIVSVQ